MSRDKPSYWTWVGDDRDGYVQTYERRMPHGTLVLTLVFRSADGVSTSMVFVPAAPHPGQERP